MHIRMISEGACDNKDWSNDTENSDLTPESFLLTEGDQTHC